jgi:alkaline phosphatase D
VSKRNLRAPFPRRRFLEATILIAAGPVACNSSEPDSNKGDAGTRALDPREYFPQSVASFDPRPNSVVLWTRVVDGDAPEDFEVRLEVALDSSFEEVLQLGRPLSAKAASDYCVRARVEGLEAGTTYYYRFVYESEAGRAISRVGRTKTAPRPEDDVKVRFAVTSCQDYSRFYHAYRLLAEHDLDFVVHLGDYIYETANDPAFQDPESERAIVFNDVEGALSLAGEASGGGRVLAARSLDNYRQLYRTYRSDPDLQRLHERFAMIAVWDDHEFANDSHGAFADSANGEEEDLERRANADQAFTEYMSLDFPEGPDFVFDRDAPFPDNLRIYRDFEFGRHLLLVMTDLRRYRPDHVIPENAFRPSIVLTEARLEALLGAVPERATPYVDLDRDDALRNELLRAAGDGVIEATPEELRGQLDLTFVNEALDAVASDHPRLDPTTLPRGIPYSALGGGEMSGFGSRYFVDYEVFSWVSRALYEDSEGQSENLMGDAQEDWFIDRMQRATQTFKVWGNEFGLMERRVDLRPFPVPEELRRELLISADDWDGAPNRRAALLERLEDTQNVVVVTGDLHSFFAGTTGAPFGDRVIEFMCGAATSSTYRAILEQSGLSLEGLGDIGVAAGLLLQAANPHMAYQDLGKNGVATVLVNGNSLLLDFHQIAFEKVRERELEGELADHFWTERFRVRSGSGFLEREVDGEFRRWDSAGQRWVT